MRDTIKISNPEKVVLGQNGSISVSSTVAILAESFFRRSLMVSGCIPEEIYEGVQDMFYAKICSSEIPVATIHADNPTTIQWGKQDPRMKNYYLSVFIDGVEYKVCINFFLNLGSLIKQNSSMGLDIRFVIIFFLLHHSRVNKAQAGGYSNCSERR